MNKRNLAYQHKANTQPTFTPMHAGRLQRKSTCAQHIDADGSEKICQQMAIHSSMDGVPPIVYEVLRSPGQPLDPATHAFMEPRFGRDFSHVRVHTDAKAVESAQALNALAYTAGQNVVFGPGQFAPRTFAGKRLLAHELTHVIQARPSTQNVPTTLTMSVPDSATEQEAEHTAQNILSDQRTRVTYRSVQLQRQQDITEEERREFEEDRRRFAEAQAEHFQIVGRLIRRNILQQAGVESGTDVTTTDEALLVIRLWGLSIDDLVGALPQLGQSLSNQVSGSQEGSTLQNRQEALVNGLTPGGQQTFRRMLNLVRSEPFWAEHLDTQTIFIFPDITGTNRYRGFTQEGTEQSPDGESRPAFIIHISKDVLEAGGTEEAAATLIHELSHTLYKPNITARSLNPFLMDLARLLADHPRIVSLRQGAPDADDARQTHIRRIRLILYERTAYAEEEIFVHLQQLTHQPSVTIEGESLRGSYYILAQVEGFLNQLKRIGLPRRMLLGILDSLGRRVGFLYDRRIAAARDGSRRRRLLEINKRMAMSLLNLARAETETER